jgi:hypothetical protein
LVAAERTLPNTLPAAAPMPADEALAVVLLAFVVLVLAPNPQLAKIMVATATNKTEIFFIIVSCLIY